MRSVRIAAACLTAVLALSGFTAATASAETPEESATQEAATAESAEEAAEAPEVAEQAAEDEAGTAQYAAVVRKKHPGIEYQLHHIRNELRWLRARRTRLKTHKPSALREAWKLRTTQELAKVRKRRHEVLKRLKEVELKEKER